MKEPRKSFIERDERKKLKEALFKRKLSQTRQEMDIWGCKRMKEQM